MTRTDLHLVRDASDGGDDRDAPAQGGLTDPADMPASDWEAVGGPQSAHASVVPPSEQDRPALARVDTAASPPHLSGAGGHLFPDDTIVRHVSRPHWMDQAA